MPYNPINSFELSTFEEDSITFNTEDGLVTFSTYKSNLETLLQVDFEKENKEIVVEVAVGDIYEFIHIGEFTGRVETYEALIKGCIWEKDTLSIRFFIRNL